MVRNLSKEHSVVNQYLHELRDKDIQKDRLRFTTNIERVGMICGYEISKELAYEPSQVLTKFGTAQTMILCSQPVVATILRAGLPLSSGILKVLDGADGAFVAAKRQKNNTQAISPVIGYTARPRLNDRTLILADTMIATGNTIIESYKILTKNNEPQRTFIVAVIASQEGIANIEKSLPNISIIVGTMDTELNQDFFIVPGLGDAGDLLYGNK